MHEQQGARCVWFALQCVTSHCQAIYRLCALLRETLHEILEHLAMGLVFEQARAAAEGELKAENLNL